MHVSLLVTLMPIPLVGGPMSQPISEPTNFEDNKSPSCIDLIICDQPNVEMEMIMFVNTKWHFVI